MKQYILLLSLLFISQAIIAQILLKKGSPVFIELTTEANSNKKQDVRAVVGFNVEDPQTGETLITKGTPVALAVQRKKSRGLGKGGWLQIKVISTTAIDGRQILLDGIFTKEGLDRRGTALGLGIGLGLTYLPGFGFFFLMIRGQKIVLPQGSLLYDIYVAEKYWIDTSNLVTH